MASPTTDRRFGLAGGVALKAPCALATTANITLSGEQTIDGTLTDESRVLVKDQTDLTANGIYKSDTGAWTREPDFNGNRDVVTGTQVTVLDGTANGGLWFKVTTVGDITIGTSELEFEEASFNGSSFTPNTFTGDGTTVNFTLTTAPGTVDNVEVYINGLRMVPTTDYSVSGTTLTFVTAPINTAQIFTLTGRTIALRLPKFVSITDYGAIGDGSTDCTSAFNSAITALPATGGSIYFPSGTYKLTSTITISKCVSLYGDGSGQTVGTTSGSFLKFFSLGTANGIVFDGVDGAFIRDLAIVADTATRPTGGYLVQYQGTSSGWYHHTWNNVLCAGGYNGLRLKNGLYFKAYSSIWKTFNGSQVMLFNGSSDSDDVQSAEFTNCTIAAEASTTTDLVVLDGYAASTKWLMCSFLFGRHGMWLKDSYTTSNDPDFTYIIGGGFENGEGDAFRAEAGNHVVLTGAYLSADGDRSRLFYAGTGFGGEINITGCYFRGGSRGGVWLEDGNANITGNTIINNNEAGPVSVNVSNCVDNGAGLIRVTTAAHGYETNDMVTIADVVGTVEANGTWVITVINSTTFDLTTNADSDTGAASAFSVAYVSGGTSQLATASVRVLSGAEWVNVVGNTLGGGSGGIRSTEYGVHANADNVFVMNNQCQSVINAPWKSTRNTRHSYGNKNLGVASGSGKPDPYAVDGSLVYVLAGATTTGVKNLNNCVYISGYKIRVIRATRVSSNATDSTVDQTTAILRVNGSNIGVGLDHPLAGGQIGTTVTDTIFSTPLIIDGTTTPQRVEMNVTAITGTPDDVAWDWQYQIIN